MKKIIILINVILSLIFITGCTNNDIVLNTDNNDLTLEELKDIAKEKGIKGYSKMNKNDLKKELGM